MVSNHHPKGKIPTWDQKVLRQYTINDKLGDIDSNAFQKAVDKKWNTTPSMSILPRFQKDVVKNYLRKNLENEREMVHFLILNQSQVITIVKQVGSDETRLILRAVLKILQIMVIYVNTLTREIEDAGKYFHWNGHLKITTP